MIHHLRALLFLLMLPTAAALADGVALRLTIDSAIGPASADYIHKGIEKASADRHDLIIIEMDTPGGLDSAMRDIIKDILDSPVPVVTYISPNGSRAASAGTYILYASHIAAMVPVSNLGAATPVQIGGMPDLPSAPQPDEDDDTEDDEEATDDEAEKKDEAAPAGGDAMSKKMVNDAVAYIKGLAKQRNRNEEWAERAVREAVSLTAYEALEQNVIDVVAENVDDLLQQIDGRTVKLESGEVELATADLDVVEFEPDWRTQLLTIITDPNVAYLLMLVGIYGLLLEGYNPGALVPGTVGAICLLLALFAFQVLPVNYAGLALMLLGVALMIAEGFVPSFGVLGLGGVAAFVFGSIILMDSDVPGFQVARGLIGGVAAVGGLTALGIIVMLMRSRRRPVVSGAEGMVGEVGEALESFTGDGAILVEGERWRAFSTQPINKGDRVTVTGVRGLIVDIAPASGQFG